MEELHMILERFAASSRDLTAIPSQRRLDGSDERKIRASAIRQSERGCGGCALEPLYRRALVLL